MNESGTDSALSGDWPEDCPEPTLENRLAASTYLVEIGLSGGPVEDVAYRLTVELAKARAANDKMYEMLSNEKERYRARYLFEREVCSDALDEVCELEAALEVAKSEALQWESGWFTAQKKLENALSMIEDMPIDWNGLTNV